MTTLYPRHVPPRGLPAWLKSAADVAVGVVETVGRGVRAVGGGR